MTKTVSALVLLSAFGSSANAMVCAPAQTGGYFDQNLVVKVLGPAQISINDVTLERDPTYHPRTLTEFSRYTGRTDVAVGWSDSGVTEVFFDGKNRLHVTVRGEMFVSEFFNCK